MNFNSGKIGVGLALTLLAAQPSWAQVPVKLTDFQTPSKSWKEVSQVWADPSISNTLFTEGQGTVMVNIPDKKNPGKDIITTESYGDLELRLVYMMAPGSNSGLYLQGQYEIQLLDSWAKISPKAGDNGGIYERWDESRPEGQKGYEGYAPRQNASKAPGLWQTLEVGFQAPRFASSGEKIQNARIRFVRLNGVTVQEDIELQGPTRGSLRSGEVARGPIRIQGDHGPIAIQSLEITPMDTPAPSLSGLTMEVFSGSITDLNEIGGKIPVIKKSLNSLNELASGIAGSSLIKVQGTIQVAKSGNYTLDMVVPNGLGAISIGNESADDLRSGRIRVEKNLSAGSHPITFYVSKPRDWTTQGFSLQIQESGLWPVQLSQPAGNTQTDSDPIWVDTDQAPVLRSFIEMPDRGKISHAVSVSSKAGIHFSYDLSTGRLIRVWRGLFLDATPMWNNRGNGVSRPLGNLTYLNSSSKSDPITGTDSFTPKGYQIIGDGQVRFLATTATGELTDQVQLLADGKGLTRTLKRTGGSPMEVPVLEGKSIKQIRENFYWIEDAGLYLQVGDKSIKPTLNSQGQVVLPFSSELTYTLLF